MKDTLDISDLKEITRDLIDFIVVEGKEYVDDKKKEAYVVSYVYLLVKIVNQVGKKEHVSIVEDIVKDISKYIK